MICLRFCSFAKVVHPSWCTLHCCLVAPRPACSVPRWVDVATGYLGGNTVGVLYSSRLCDAGSAASSSAGTPPCTACSAGRYSSGRGFSTCDTCPARAVCGGEGVVTPGFCGVGYLCPAGSASTPTAPAFACFASNSTVAAWGSNGTHLTLVTQVGVGWGGVGWGGVGRGWAFPVLPHMCTRVCVFLWGRVRAWA
jgi:hypothetical protein